MSRGFLLIDANNIGNAAQNTQVLKAAGEETQAIYGTLRAIRMAAMAYPQLVPLVLWDGISWRTAAFPEYKANREKDASKPLKDYEIRQQRNREEYRRQKKHIMRGLKLLGVRQMLAHNLEADDLAGMLVSRYAPQGKKVLMISGDQDWLQLVGPGVGWFDPVQDKRVTITNFSDKVGYSRTVKNKETGAEHQEWRGCPSPAAYLDVKCLMGDSGDNIPGVGGIGEKGAHELLIQFGSVAEFMNRANLEALALPKKVADFAASEEKWGIYLRNRMLMDLRSKHIPAPVNLKITHEPINGEAFNDFCDEFAFHSIQRDYAAWLEPFTSVNFDTRSAA